jgi:hypothetical protein
MTAAYDQIITAAELLADHGSDDVTAPRRHLCAKVGLQRSTKKSGHVELLPVSWTSG